MTDPRFDDPRLLDPAHPGYAAAHLESRRRRQDAMIRALRWIFSIGVAGVVALSLVAATIHKDKDGPSRKQNKSQPSISRALV